MGVFWPTQHDLAVFIHVEDQSAARLQFERVADVLGYCDLAFAGECCFHFRLWYYRNIIVIPTCSIRLDVARAAKMAALAGMLKALI
jgi:hypothetical protein